MISCTQEGVRLTQTDPQPDHDHRPYFIAGLAVIGLGTGLGLGLLLQDSLVRENCRRVMRDPQLRVVCRDAAVRAVASFRPEVDDGAAAMLSP